MVVHGGGGAKYHASVPRGLVAGYLCQFSADVRFMNDGSSHRIPHSAFR